MCIRDRLKGGVVGGDQFVLVRALVVMVAQHGFKQVQVLGKGRRANGKHGKDEHAHGHLDLIDGGGAGRKHNAPGIDEQHSLFLVVAFLDQAVVDVALVGLPDANVGALAAHDLSLIHILCSKASRWATLRPRWIFTTRCR